MRAPITPERGSYAEVVDAFRWPRPARFNIAEAVCDRHARAVPDAPALIAEDEAGAVTVYDFRTLARDSNRLANALAARGVGRGDRVAIVLSQGYECLLTHLAAYKLGAIAIPLSPLFGPEGLQHRLSDSGAKAAVVTPAGADILETIRDALPALTSVLCVGGPAPGCEAFAAVVERASDSLNPVDTAADDPALLIYTSGTTGLAKGALHAHRTLLGHLPGVEFTLRYFPKPGDVYWTPADWSWVAGLLDVVMPSLYHAVPVVARRLARFDPEVALDLMIRHKVRNTLITPTALKLIRQVMPGPRPGIILRSMISGGEPVGEALLDWGRTALGMEISEAYGQTEANLIIGGNADVYPHKPGTLGRAIPGHRVAIVSDEGEVLPPGEEGQIALHRPDPVLFLEYWNNPQATAEKFAGDWCLTGDLGVMDADGDITFGGRTDDLINASGYRIGPVEIEACLMRHPKVALVGVVGKPDPEKGEIVKAFVVPADGVEPSPDLAKELKAFVRSRLAAYQYPREIAFIDEMPVTVSGKVRRKDLREM